MKVGVVAALVAVLSFSVVAEEDGGELYLFPKDHGMFVIVNAQSRVPEKLVANAFAGVVNGLSIDARVVKGSAPKVAEAPAAVSQLKAKGAIWVVDDPSMPISLSAIEDGWGYVNVAPLAVGADEAKTGKRLVRAALRLFASMYDVGDSTMMPACVMRPSHGVSGLDELECGEYSPDAMTRISAGLEKAGFKFAHSGTYYDACEEGWAPMPTNKVQQAIWDKVHQLPTKPLTIRRESERGKGK